MSIVCMEDWNALIVIPTPALIDWVNALLGDAPFTYSEPFSPDQGTVYLIPPFFDLEEVNEWIKDHFREIFEHELSDWWDDQANWPELTFENFQLFYRTSWQSVVNGME